MSTSPWRLLLTGQIKTRRKKKKKKTREGKTHFVMVSVYGNLLSLRGEGRVVGGIVALGVNWLNLLPNAVAACYVHSR